MTLRLTRSVILASALCMMCHASLSQGLEPESQLEAYVTRVNGQVSPEAVPRIEALKFFVRQYGRRVDDLELPPDDNRLLRSFFAEFERLDNAYGASGAQAIQDVCAMLAASEASSFDVSAAAVQFATVDGDFDNQATNLFDRTINLMSPKSARAITRILEQEISKSIGYTRIDIVSAAAAMPELFSASLEANCNGMHLQLSDTNESTAQSSSSLTIGVVDP